MELDLKGENVHSHFGIYVIKGSERTLLLDTGHPVHVAAIDAALDEFLDGRAIDFIFPTHAEFPHFGLLPKWLSKYPEAVVVGDVRDYHLYYPESENRFEPKHLGDYVDLGDRRLIFVPAVWSDLKDTFWGFDTGDSILFVADGFSLSHHHTPGQCGLVSSEQSLPAIDMMRVLNELALQWTRYTDVRSTFDSLDRLIDLVQPQIIAPAHGFVIDTPECTIPLIKQGMEGTRLRGA